MRLVRWADHRQDDGAASQVVLRVVSATSLGAGPRGFVAAHSAVQVVERRVETPVPIPPTRHDWSRLLGELVTQLDKGRIYNRDLDELSVALTAIGVSMTRRLYIRSLTAARPH